MYLNLIGRANKYIDETTPWILAKDEEKKARLGTVLYNLAESLRFASVMISAFLPDTAKKINEQINTSEISWDSLKAFDGTKAGTKVVKGENLFPRIDVDKKLRRIRSFKSSNEANPAKREITAYKRRNNN